MTNSMDYWSFSSCDERVPRSTFNEMKTIEQTEEHLEYERQKNHLLIMKNESLRNANQQFVSSYESLKMQMNELLQERTALFQKNVSIIYQHNRYKKELQAYREMLIKTTKRNRALLDELLRNNILLERFLSTSSHENEQCLYDFDYTTENCNQMKIENKGNEQNSPFRGRLRPGDPLLTPVQEEENCVSIVQETFVIDSLEKRLNIQMQNNNNSEGRVLSSPQGSSKFKGSENHCKYTVDKLVNINKTSNDHQNSATTDGQVQELLLSGSSENPVTCGSSENHETCGSSENHVTCGSSENHVTLKNVRDFFPPVQVHQKIVPLCKVSQPFDSINSKNVEINSEEGPIINCQSDHGQQKPAGIFSGDLEGISDSSSVKTEKDKLKKKYAVRNTSKNAKKRLSFESKNKRGRKKCVLKILDDEVEREIIESNVAQDKDERKIKSSSRNGIKYNIKKCEEKGGDIETCDTQILCNTKTKPTPTKCKKNGKIKLPEVCGIQTRSKVKKDKQPNGDNSSNEEDAKLPNNNARKTNIIGVNVTPCEDKIALPCTRNKKEIQSNDSVQQGPKPRALKKRAKAKTDSDSLNKKKCSKQGDKNLPISTPKSNINSSDSIDFDEISISPINKLIIQISDNNNTILPTNKRKTEPNDKIIPAGHDLQKNKLDCKYTVLKDLLRAKTNNGINTCDDIAQLKRILTSLGINDKIATAKSDVGSEKLVVKADSMKDDSGIQIKIDTSSEPIDRAATDTSSTIPS